jgi:acyl dehydratase
VALKDSKSRPNACIVTWEHRAINQRGETVCTMKRTAMIQRKAA